MLATLKVQNLVVVENLEVDFSPGLNVITGETGAGKSIILKGIQLICGDRSSADLIRSGADKCSVEALFHLSEDAVAMLGHELPDLIDIISPGELLIKRVVETTGRSKVYLNGELATVGQLQQLAVYLVDITSQHQTRSLLDPDYHLLLLDDFAGTTKLREELREQFSIFKRAEKLLNELRARAEQEERLTAELQSRLLELRVTELRSGRKEELEAEIKRISGSEQLAGALAKINTLLETEDFSVDSALRDICGLLKKNSELDSTLGTMLGSAEEIYSKLSDLRYELAKYAAQLDSNPDRIEELRGELSAIAKLERRFGLREDGLVKMLEDTERELGSLQGVGAEILKVEKQVSDERTALSNLEQALSKKRRAAAKELETEIQNGLKDLKMAGAKFFVEIKEMESSSTGVDDIRFLLAANPGEPPKPLDRAASGGELSRTLLVTKVALNSRAGALTQIFDEIDQGVSGIVAQLVGEKLKRLSENFQIIVVTHSPQVAAMGSNHLFVEKTVSGNRTSTEIRQLGKDERVKKLAEMLGGKSSSNKFEDSARELLKN
jgi:DNA repair protein RecN (Recombination protein N)